MIQAPRMRKTVFLTASTTVLGIVLGALGARILDAQPAGIKRTMLLKTDLAGIEGKEAYLGHAELAPGAAAGKHYHHGHELGYILESAGIMEVEGKPSWS